MTHCTTFVGGNPWKAQPQHRPRGWAIEPVAPEPVIVIEKHTPTPMNGRRMAILAQIKKAGSASISELVAALGVEQYVARRALAALYKEGQVRRKSEASTGATPQYRYFAL